MWLFTVEYHNEFPPQYVGNLLRTAGAAKQKQLVGEGAEDILVVLSRRGRTPAGSLKEGGSDW